jgi:hypothetical protein
MFIGQDISVLNRVRRRWVFGDYSLKRKIRQLFSQNVHGSVPEESERPPARTTENAMIDLSKNLFVLLAELLAMPLISAEELMPYNEFAKKRGADRQNAR